MKGIITLFFTGFTLLAIAQTPLIAHKSHSGSSLSFFIDPSSNFGESPEMRKHWEEQYLLSETKTFIPLNDSIILVEVRNFEQTVIRTDTIPNREKLSSFTFEFKYRDSILKNGIVESKKQRDEHEKQFIKEQMEQQQKIQETAPPKKKKKSYLLFLFGITGGGMLLMRLFRSSKPQQSIA